MNKFIVLSILLLGLSAVAADPYHAFTTENTYVWSDPGYSWKDCRGLDPNSEYSNIEDLTLSQKRFNGGGKAACEKRQSLLDSGTDVAIIRNADGSLVSEERELMYSGELIKKRFFRVWVRDKNGKENRGWISESSLTRPTAEKEDQTIKPDPVSAVDDPNCPPTEAKQNSSKASNGPAQVLRETRAIRKVLEHKDLGLERKIDHASLKLGPRKTDAEIDRFMCLYRSGSDEKNFEALLKKFKTSAKAAEISFGVPYALTMCFALTESSLKFETAGEYRGYGQFGSDRVEDLKAAIEKSPYAEMWADYRSKVSKAKAFSDDAIRSTNSPETSTAAIAFALRHMYGDLFRGKCADCSSAQFANAKTASMNQINRKDLYLMIGGYNYTPSKITQMSKRTTAGLASSHPPPEESRNYMRQMDNCMAQGEETHFRAASGTRANVRRAKEIAQIRKKKQASTQEKAQVKKLQDLIAHNVSQEYEDKEAECNRTHPK